MKYLKQLMVLAVITMMTSVSAFASSHREAPLISNDPLADNTDLYVFRSPDNPNTITIIANYIPFELPEGGPNYASFGENIRYEIHVRNQAAATGGGNGDDITYRFTFTKMNEDPTTFFNIRLGKENLKTTYKCEKSIDGGATWTTVVAAGIVPPANIGPRSIGSPYGVYTGKTYTQIMQSSISTGTAGEKIYAGPCDDPFFVDLGGIFDLGGFDSVGRDGVAGFNCHTICIQIPIEQLQKDKKMVAAAKNILDGDYVIGVWASASRPKMRVFNGDGTMSESGNYVQISRLGMPLSNEAIIPIGSKDKWNSFTPYDAQEVAISGNFANPELGLYIGGKDYSPYGFAVPGLAKLKIDSASIKYTGLNGGKGFDFRYGKDGLYPLKGSAAVAGTALDDAVFGNILLQKAMPRSVDILPIFYTGVPNLAPYHLATGKAGNPLANGKPFINNFLPTLGDMLRINMATPATDRKSADFSSEGLIQAAVLGLLDARFNKDASIQAIPNMDGFPNGRRLEDDITTIEMQAVGGLVLNAIGLWTDDYTGGPSPVTTHLLNKVTWTAGVAKNDVPLQAIFPYVAPPHEGYTGLISDRTARKQHTVPSSTTGVIDNPSSIGIRPPSGFFLGQNFPNPVSTSATTLNYHTSVNGSVVVTIFDIQGRAIATLVNAHQTAGDYTASWTPTGNIATGTYMATLSINGERTNSMKVTISK